MTRKFILLLLVALAMLAALPAFAYNALSSCRGHVRWNDNDVTWRPSLTAFPQGSGWYNSIDASRVAWNAYTPGGNYRINYIWDTNNVVTFNDNRNSITMPNPWLPYTSDPYDVEPLAVAYMRRSMCYAWPGPDANWVEGDIAFNRDYSWENSTNPVAPYGSPYNSTLVALHEHGHGMGLDHENDFPATMNAIYPNGGPIGTGSYVHPHADDARGDRAIYGTAASQRDVASYAYRLSVPSPKPGSNQPIPPPPATSRNTSIAFQFSVENRGTYNQSSIPVYFYLTPTRNGVTTSSFFLGSTTLSIDAGRTVTPTAYVNIPSWAPTGWQYIGWIADPYNSITGESDETNNGVTHTQPFFISTNSAPTACFTAYPTYGQAPLNVQLDASCSSDPDGNPVTYSWDFGDGITGSGQFTDHWYYFEGFYQVQLTVTDSNGASSITSDFIQVICDSGSQIECPE